MFSTLSRIFSWTGFGLICARWSVRYLTVYSVLGSEIKANIREFKKLLRQRRRQRRLKMNLYFTYESQDTRKSFKLFLFVKTITKLVVEHSVKFEI